MLSSFFKSFYQTLRSIKNSRKNQYFSDMEAFLQWVKNWRVSYKIYSQKDTQKYLKKSDTLFILGSGPSFNTLTSEEVSMINEHDSFGISYSFLREDIQPTYHIFSYEVDGSHNYLKDVFNKFKHNYLKTSIILLDRAVYRYIHPRIVPDFFPESRICSFIRFPDQPMVINQKEDLTDAVFDRGFFAYRGSMSTALHVAINLGYKKIVMIGVDLHTFDHFFDDHPLMQEHAQKYFSKEFYKTGKKFDSMYTKPGKALTFDEYLVKLEDYLRRKKGIQIYTSRPSDFMADKLPIFFNN